jgi:hypothetical protein
VVTPSTQSGDVNPIYESVRQLGRAANVVISIFTYLIKAPVVISLDNGHARRRWHISSAARYTQLEWMARMTIPHRCLGAISGSPLITLSYRIRLLPGPAPDCKSKAFVEGLAGHHHVQVTLLQRYVSSTIPFSIARDLFRPPNSCEPYYPAQQR